MTIRTHNRLTTLQVTNLKAHGKHADGGGLYLFVDDNRRNWFFLYRWRGKRVELGLGSARSLSLAKARLKASQFREMLADGKNPKSERNREDRQVTFGSFADDYVVRMTPSWKNPKHIAQWKMTLEVYAEPLRPMIIEEIETQDVLKVLEPIWTRVPETADRLRGRIEKVLDAAKALGLRDGENPAHWRGHLDQLLPRRKKSSQSHHAALPFYRIARFVGNLRKRLGISARALEFLILTAARTSEVLNATWDEIDLKRKIWIIPANRMKAEREHRVPLTTAAMALLKATPEEKRQGFLFKRSSGDMPLTNMAMPMLLRRMELTETVHGFRSTFRDWAAEETSFPNEVCEMALAHAIAGKAEAAYRRGDLFEKRRKLMEDWAEYCGY